MTCADSKGTCVRPAATVACADATTAGCKSDGKGGFEDACASLATHDECAAVDSDSNSDTTDCDFSSDGSSVPCTYCGSNYLAAEANAWERPQKPDWRFSKISSPDTTRCILCPDGTTPMPRPGLHSKCEQTTKIDCGDATTDATTAGCKAKDGEGFEDACASLTTQTACAAVDSDSDLSTADCSFTNNECRDDPNTGITANGDQQSSTCPLFDHCETCTITANGRHAIGVNGTCPWACKAHSTPDDTRTSCSCDIGWEARGWDGTDGVDETIKKRLLIEVKRNTFEGFQMLFEDFGLLFDFVKYDACVETAYIEGRISAPTDSVACKAVNSLNAAGESPVLPSACEAILTADTSDATDATACTYDNKYNVTHIDEIEWFGANALERSPAGSVLTPSDTDSFDQTAVLHAAMEWFAVAPTCVDIDECTQMNEGRQTKGNCGAVGICENVDGGRKCTCPSGYTKNETLTTSDYSVVPAVGTYSCSRIPPAAGSDAPTATCVEASSESDPADKGSCADVTSLDNKFACEAILTADTSDADNAKACTYQPKGEAAGVSGNPVVRMTVSASTDRDEFLKTLANSLGIPVELLQIVPMPASTTRRLLGEAAMAMSLGILILHNDPALVLNLLNDQLKDVTSALHTAVPALAEHTDFSQTEDILVFETSANGSPLQICQLGMVHCSNTNGDDTLHADSTADKCSKTNPKEERASSCTYCINGYISTSEKYDTCVACGAGKYTIYCKDTTSDGCQSATGRGYICAKCNAGAQTQKYAKNENDVYDGESAEIGGPHVATAADRCLDCIAGRYQSDEGASTACVECEKGSETRDASSEIGTYNDLGATRCVKCPAGKYQTMRGNDKPCAKCAAGQETVWEVEGEDSYTALGATLCALCIAGKRQEEEGATAPCAKCSAGQETVHKAEGEDSYTASGATLCKPCVAGKYQEEEGAATACRECAQGSETRYAQKTYASTGAVHCEKCRVGMYQTQKGATKPCDRCAKGSETRDATNNGKYTNTGAVACASCPTGYHQDKESPDITTEPSKWEQYCAPTHCKAAGAQRPYSCAGCQRNYNCTKCPGELVGHTCLRGAVIIALSVI